MFWPWPLTITGTCCTLSVVINPPMHTHSHKQKKFDIEGKCCNISVSVLVVKVCSQERAEATVEFF